MLENKPSFSPAKTRLAEIRMKDGSFDQAKELFESIGDGEENIKKMTMAKQQIEHGKTLLEVALSCRGYVYTFSFEWY